MSRLPNPEGVARVRDYLLGQMTTESLIYELRERIKNDTVALEAANVRHRINANALEVEMTKMDLTESGNTGHERRMHDFLCMLTEATLKGYAP